MLREGRVIRAALIFASVWESEVTYEKQQSESEAEMLQSFSECIKLDLG